MTDRTRARRLAIASAIVIVLFLYLLGGLSLYLRSLLPPEAGTAQVPVGPTGAPFPDGAATAPAGTEPQKSLLPTITPRPGLAGLWVFAQVAGWAAPGGSTVCAP